MKVKLKEVCAEKIDTINASYNGIIDYIDISSVDNEQKKIITVQTVAASEAPSRARQLIKHGDILVSMVRPNLNAVAMVGNSFDNLPVASTGYCVLRCNKNVDNHYVFHYCQSPTFVESMAAQATGASYPAVNVSIIKSSFINLPSLPEQKKISFILDKVNNLISLRKQQLAKLDELVKSRFIELFGDLAAPHCKWKQAKLVDTCANSDDIKCGPFGTQLSKEEYQSSGVAVWEIPQINSLFSTSPIHFLAKEKAQQLDSYSIRPGDIAMSRKGNVGKCAVFPSHFEPGIIHSDVLRIRVNDSRVLPIFMMNQLHFSSAVQRQIELVSSGAIMAGINVTKLKQIFIHIPPLSLQEQFVTFVEQIDKSKLTIQQSLDKLELLKKALMQEYFG